MKGTMRASVAQGINLTPQLLQSIRLLQLSAPQLEQTLRDALEHNPMLEREDEEGDEAGDSPAPEAACEVAAWDELPEPAFLSGGGTGTPSDGDDATQRVADGESSDPRQRLLALLALHWTGAELELAAWWLDRCDDRGYLEAPLDTLLAEGRLAFPGRDAALALARTRLLHGDWPGMAADGPAECLRAQLRVLPDSTPRGLALRIVDDHLPALAAHDPGALADALDVAHDDACAAAALVLALRPYPVPEPPVGHGDHVVPDVVAWRADGGWQVALNRRGLPRVRVAAHCERALGAAAGAHPTLQGLLEEARWLVRGVAMRDDTLLRTARVLVQRQAGFLERGDEAIAPLTLREVADEVGVHESTISRIVNGKYMQTPRGTLELKRMFAVRLEGAAVSGSAVRAMVKRLIDAEPAAAPLADDVIAGLLARQGVRVARRTVAKYRDQLHIGPARARGQAAIHPTRERCHA